VKAIQAKAKGDAIDVLEVIDIDAPDTPQAAEVLIDVEYSPLNEHDLFAIAGVLPGGEPPWIPGNEGTGIVAEVGSAVTDFKVGQRVLIPVVHGAWRQQFVLPAAALTALPDADAQQLSMVGINSPTAALLLSETAEVPDGAWVVQNAANSGVGRNLIALAHARGMKTINFARREETFDELRSFGADLVLPDTPEGAMRAKELIGDALVPLAVDGVGGPSTLILLDMLTDGGVLAAYGAVSGDPLWLNPLVLNHRHATARGFFVLDYDWDSKQVPAILEAAHLLADEKFTVPVAGVFGLHEFGDALAALQRGGGKILFAPDGASQGAAPYHGSTGG
jgi:NADPH:quinone reductase-like Zn-dependent oxidoreductase